MSHHPLRAAAQQTVFELFRDAKPGTPLLYHGFRRAHDLVAHCKEIARRSDLDEDDLEVLLLAAWFRDACYATGPDGDRERSIALARDFLEKNGQSDLAEAVAACISGGSDGDGAVDRSDRDKILHDAHLVPLATDRYVEDAGLLRVELEHKRKKPFTDVEWTQECIKYLESHSYSTRYAQLQYNGGRSANLARLYRLVDKQADEARELKAAGDKDKKAIGKTIESMFQYMTRLQVNLVIMADRRTSTMVHVNAIMISIVVGLLLRRSDSAETLASMRLIVPTLILLAVNLAVVFISILSMRSARSSLARAEAPIHDGNLLAFTNETPMTLGEYTERMTRLIPDEDELRKTMINQLYFVRKVLIRRQHWLRITYDVFIGGLAVALLAFGIALFTTRGR